MQIPKHARPNVIVNTPYVHMWRSVCSLHRNCKHQEMSSSVTHCGKKRRKCLHLFYFCLFTDWWIVWTVINLYFQRRTNKTPDSITRSAALVVFLGKAHRRQWHPQTQTKKGSFFPLHDWLFESLICYKKLNQHYVTGLYMNINYSSNRNI